MKTFIKLLLIGTVLMTALAMFGGFVAWHGLHDGANWHINIDGDELNAASDLGDWIGAAVGLGIAMLVCVIVVPLVLLIGVAVPLLVVGGLLAAMVVGVLGFSAVIGSPLIILGLVLYFAMRQRRRALPHQLEPRA